VGEHCAGICCCEEIIEPAEGSSGSRDSQRLEKSGSRSLGRGVGSLVESNSTMDCVVGVDIVGVAMSIAGTPKKL